MTYWRDDETDPRGPFESFLELCDGADLIVSYNGLHFDTRPHVTTYIKTDRLPSQTGEGGG